MCKLLQAGLRRYLKDIPLWICIAVAFLSGAFLGNQIYLMNTPSINTVCFLVPLLLFSILTSLSLGREFDDGAIRNKIISGHSRASIFFSELILAAASCSTLFFSFFISFAITNIENLSRVPFEIGVNVWIGCLLLSILSAVLHSVVTLLLSNRTLAIVINLVLVLVFVLLTFIFLIYIFIVVFNYLILIYKIILAYIFIFIVCTLGLNTFGLWFYYAQGKKTFLVYLIGRAPFQAINIVINIVITYVLYIPLKKFVFDKWDTTNKRAVKQASESGVEEKPEEK